MQTVELLMLLATAVLISSFIDQIVPKVSLPLIQIALGVVIALLAVSPIDVTFSSDFFLVMFIAPLLFHDAENANKLGLWHRRREIIALAIGLVVVIVLVTGYSLNWLVPSVPLAAAFALGAALGPTDAVAVSSLSQVAKLEQKDDSLLSGEALLNDATGVVSFQFAVAAAVTGSFSLLDASVSFLFEFFGGIIVGIILAILAHFLQEKAREKGLDSTTFHVLYEVSLPFLIYLISMILNVSGILAVVAAGLLYGSFSERTIGPMASRLNIVSTSVWQVLAFALNGVVFVLLGMQLPHAMMSTWDDVSISNLTLIGYILFITLVIVIIRFLWIVIVERVLKDPVTKQHRTINKSMLRSALVNTVGGPKGAVTLSVIFSLPLVLDDGSAFPQRNLLIFLASGVILCTLLIANFALPALAPRKDESMETDEDIARIKIEIMRRVIEKLTSAQNEDNERATRAVIKGYNDRIGRIQNLADLESESTDLLRIDVISCQEEYLMERLEKGQVDEDNAYEMLQRLARAKNLLRHGHIKKMSVAKRDVGKAVIGFRRSVFLSIRLLYRWVRSRFLGDEADNPSRSAMTDLRIDLSNVAVECIQQMIDALVPPYPMEVLTGVQLSYLTAAHNLEATRPDLTLYTKVSIGMEEVERLAYHMELEEIQGYCDAGKLSRSAGKNMRDNVYLMLVDLDDHV